MTKQHIIPRRWASLRPDAPLHHDQYLEIDGKVVRHRRIEGRLGQRKIRRVCVHCNGGWIAVAEDAAFNVVKRLVFDEVPTLSNDDQAKLSLQACLLAAMMDLAGGAASVITQEDRDFLKAKQAPPPHWRVLIGRTMSRQWSDRWLHHTAAMPPDRPPAGNNTQITTVGYGRMMIQVISCNGYDVFEEEYERELGLRLIFPRQGVLDVAKLPILYFSDSDRAAMFIWRMAGGRLRWTFQSGLAADVILAAPCAFGVRDPKIMPWS